MDQALNVFCIMVSRYYENSYAACYIIVLLAKTKRDWRQNNSAQMNLNVTWVSHVLDKPFQNPCLCGCHLEYRLRGVGSTKSFGPNPPVTNQNGPPLGLSLSHVLIITLQIIRIPRLQLQEFSKYMSYYRVNDKKKCESFVLLVELVCDLNRWPRIDLEY